MIYHANTTTDEMLATWDRGESVWSVQMGGLGPAYEQCIQLLAVELVREYNGKPLPEAGAWEGWGDGVVNRLNPDLGFTGAQVGAAKNLAAKILRMGYGHAMCEMDAIDSDRMIQVQREFPRVTATTNIGSM